MKVNGIKATEPKPEIVVIPREGGNLVFTCKCVIDYNPFEKICPQPTPPKIIMPGNVHSVDYDDKEYTEAIKDWSNNRHYYMLIASIKDCVDFDLIKMSDSKTWKKMDDEFKKAGIVGVEYSTIINAIITANGLNADKLEEAKESFLAEKAVKVK